MTAWAVLAQEVRRLPPDCFALVMATGIVSMAAAWLEIPYAARVLLGINVVAYGALCLLSLGRLVRYFPEVMADLTSHTRGPGLLTLVAGSCTLGSQCVLITGSLRIGRLFWIFGLLAWVILTYAFFTAMAVRDPKPTLRAGVHGGWLIAVVATQSIAILGVQAAGSLAAWGEATLFLALALYLVGGMLYLVLITILLYRFLFFALAPEELTPPSWINMGATAITTLAGATLIPGAAQWKVLHELRPFLTGWTLLFWATGTWWIPLLIILEVWRHAVRRVRIRYDPQIWSLVFPLGMYTVATFELARSAGLALIAPIASVMGYLALLAWLAAFLGLLRRLWRELLPLLLGRNGNELANHTRV